MSALLRTHPQASLAISCRQWLSHRCVHLSSQAAPTPASPVVVNTNQKSKFGVIEALGLSAAQTRKATKKIKRPEKLPAENLVTLHLEKLQETPLTFEDIETDRPPQIPSPYSPNYEKKYREVIDSLTRSFNLTQMQQFLESSNIPLPRQKIKSALAAQILEKKWGWNSLESVLQQQIDWSEVSEEHFPLDNVQAFLLVGKDGTEVLHLSKRYEVQISFISNPMSLKVTGLKGSLKEIKGYLESFKENIEVESYLLPFQGSVKVDTGLISRLSGAYVKATNDSEMSISFLRSRPTAGDIAKRLILQVATKEIGQCTRAVCLPKHSNVSGLSRYALYPFLPPNPLTWQKSSTSTFRYRRLGENFMKFPPLAALKDSAEGSAENLGIALTTDNSEIDIKAHLLSQISMSDVSPASLVFTASSGQFFFLSPSNQRPTLLPPLAGQVDPTTILRWVDDRPDQVTFHPSAPFDMLSAPAYEVQNIRRLVYRTANPPISDPAHVTDSPFSTTSVTLEIPAPESKVLKEGSTGLPFPLKNASCFKSIETHLDLLMPEGPGDIKISASNTQTIPFDTWPEELKNIKTLSLAEAEENIPFTFTLNDTTYFFHQDTYVHRSLKDISVVGAETLHHNVIVENTIDHETGRAETTCKVVCEDHSTTPGWSNFLQMCNRLASPQSQGGKTI